MKIESPYEFGQEIEVRHHDGCPWQSAFFVGIKAGCIIADTDDFRVWSCHRPIPTKKKRLMTAKELAGKWIRINGEKNCGSLCWSFSGEQFTAGSTYIDVIPQHEYTDTPADDSSWKSVEVEE